MAADRKPIHAFALALWIIAGLLAVSQVSELAVLRSHDEEASGVLQDAFSLIGWWKAIVSGLSAFAHLGAAAVIIELVDHLRWLATPEQHRAALAHNYLIARWRKSKAF